MIVYVPSSKDKPAHDKTETKSSTASGTNRAYKIFICYQNTHQSTYDTR